MRHRLKLCTLWAAVACLPVSWYRAAVQAEKIEQAETDRLNKAFAKSVVRTPITLHAQFLHWSNVPHSSFPVTEIEPLRCIGEADSDWRVTDRQTFTLLRYNPDRSAFFLVESQENRTSCYVQCPWTHDGFDSWWLFGTRHTNLVIDALRRQQVNEEETKRRVSQERSQLSKIVGHPIEEP